MTDAAGTRGGGCKCVLSTGVAVVATIALFSGSGCVVTRLARPAYEGTVVDSATQAPVQGVNVICPDLNLLTDAQGKFALPARTYLEVTWPGGEAPALGFGFSLRKAGYCKRQVDYFSPHGGSGSAGNLWKVRIPLIPVANGPCPPAHAP